MAGVVNRRGGVVHAADQSVLVGVLRHAREVFRDLDAGDIGLDRLVGTADLDRRVGLHVPGVELRGAADQHQEDAVDVLRVFVDRALRLQAEELRQTEAKRGQRAGVQEIAPPESVTELHRAIGIQTEHERPSRTANQEPLVILTV